MPSLMLGVIFFVKLSVWVKKEKKVATGGGGFLTLVSRDTRHPPFHYTTASVLVPCQVLNVL